MAELRKISVQEGIFEFCSIAQLFFCKHLMVIIVFHYAIKGLWGHDKVEFKAK
jgi:hypothetical protein